MNMLSGPDRSYELELLAVRPESVSQDVKTFVLQRPDSYVFSPGQFAWLETEPRNAVPMAIGSGIGDPTLEFSIRYSDSCAELFSRVPGHRLRLSSAQGSAFPLHESSAHSATILIAGGTGAVPIRSALRSLDLNVTRRAIFGARHSRDLLYVEELSGIGEVTLTVDDDSQWSGEFGQVTEHLDNIAPDVLVFACGPDPMMVAVCQALIGRGVKPESIYLSVQALDDAGGVLGPVLKSNDPRIVTLLG
ncbi:MAG: hypothetical protein AAFP04_05165 [Myxococcota bacterium]